MLCPAFGGPAVDPYVAGDRSVFVCYLHAFCSLQPWLAVARTSRLVKAISLHTLVRRGLTCTVVYTGIDSC